MPPAVHGAHRRRAQVCRERRKVHGPVGLQGDGDRVPPRIERHREGAGGGAGLAARVRRPVHRAHDVVVLPGDRRCARVEEGEPDRLADGVREVDAPGARPPEDPEEVHDADGERGLPRDEDVLVTWEPPFAISIVDFFRVFRGTSPRGIDLANPIGETIGLSFLDPGAAAVPGEHYYVVRSVNGTANASSETSPTAGAFTVSLDAGWNAISIPLEPYGAMDLAALPADLGATAVGAMDGGGHRLHAGWRPGHPHLRGPRHRRRRGAALLHGVPGDGRGIPRVRDLLHRRLDRRLLWGPRDRPAAPG